MVPLSEILRFAGEPERIRTPQSEIFVTVRLYGQGAVRRNIGAGKTPVAFTGYRVRSGQFIYSRIDARNGAFAIIPPELDGAVVSKDFPVFDIRTDRVETRYLVHYFKAGRLQRQIQQLSLGATNRQRITEDRFLAFPMPLPPLDEQRRIAAILGHADKLRSYRRLVLSKFDELSRALFHDMFGDPLSNSQSLPTKRLQDWISPKRPITYGILKPGPEIDDGIPYIRVADMKNGGIDVNTVRKTTREISDQYKRSLVQAGDLLMSIRGHVGRFAFIPDALDGANITQDSARLAIDEQASAVYVRACMEMPSIQHWMARRTKGAAVQGINLGDLREAPIPSPPMEKQMQFAAALAEVRRIASVSDEQLQLADSAFVSLQSSAFRGEL